MEWHAFVISVILLLVVSDSDARSLEQVCSRTCETNEVRKFFAKNNQEYSYNYETFVRSSFHAAATEEQTANLKINTDFSIITSTDCNLVLQINRGVRFDNRRPETRDERDWQRAVTAHPLYFQWENGVVKQVCSSTEEPTWVVNFKKGILSALQSSADQTTSSVQEVDVSGTCESDYLVQESGYYGFEIRKNKDYSTCENRNDHLLFSWSMPYEFDSLRQNYIESRQRCVQTVSDVLREVRCDEEHTFRPFSTEETGARTAITQIITFTSQQSARSYEAEEFAMRKSSLTYENEAETSSLSMQDKTTEAKGILTEICANMDGESYNLVSKQFMSLVSAVRKLDADSLIELRDHADSCSEHSTPLHQMLANTLPFCGTEGCVTFASTLIRSGEIEENVARRWLAGFGLIKQPTTGMISSVLDIVESNIYPQQSFLSIGSMIHQYCENSEGNCMDNSEIRTTVEAIMQHLGSNCHSVTAEGRIRTLLTLRAIGNAGQTTSVPTLKRCIVETMNSLEVRIAAIDAFRRMSCGTDRSGLLATLEDSMEDAELRIAAYRNLMQCPTDSLLVKVKALLEREENMQVGSYIWSHLNEMLGSQDPLKIFFGKMLEPHTFKKFDLDFRKYSRYYEATVFSENFNSGGSADASIVWSPKSFIPRSVSSNVTIHMFGQAINLFELGGRIEGAEDYLQSILEPKNAEKRKESQNLIDSETRRHKNTRETPASKTHISGFMRVFGKELSYYNTEMMTAEDSQESDYWGDFMTKFMSNEGYSYHDDTLLLDSAHTLPTGIGMPLYMNFKGSSSLDVQAQGRLNLAKVSSGVYAVNGKFTPRAAITVSGSMIIDTHARKTGIATESVGYTSTSISGSVALKNGGENFEIELESPFDRNMAMNFNHKLLNIVGDHTERFSTAVVADAKLCSDEFLGHRLCYTNSFQDNQNAASGYIFPASGEIEISTYSEKMDSSLTKYTASVVNRAIYDEGAMIPSQLMLQIDFDTPGTTANRKAIIMASYNIPDRQMAMIINNGDEVSRLQGYYISTDDSKTFEISANINGEAYSFKTDAQWSQSDEQKTATAGIALIWPENNKNVEAGLVYRPGQSMVASLEMTNVLSEPVVFKAALNDLTGSASKMSFSGDVEMRAQPYINSRWLVDMELNPDWDNIGFSVNYKVGTNPKESITFHHKRIHNQRQTDTQYSIDHLLSSTQFASLNYKINLEHGFSQDAMASTLNVAFGASMLEATNPYKVTFRQEFSDNSNSTATAKSGKIACTMPFMNIDKELKGSYVNSDRVLSMSLEGKSGDKTRYAKFMWGSNGPETQLISQNFAAEIYETTFGKWTMSSSLNEFSKNIYNMESSLSMGTTGELQFVQKAVVVNLPSNKTVRFQLVKGSDNEILLITSKNIANEGEYYSKNLIQVAGYQSRGLDIVIGTIPQGNSASIEFLKDAIVSVGAVFRSTKSDNGRHSSVAVTQHDVHQRTITLKYGYELAMPRQLESYVQLTQDEAPIFSTDIAFKTMDNGNRFGNVTVMANAHESLPLTEGLDFYTSVSANDDNGYRFDVIHHNKNKKINFHVENAENGVQGTLDQTYMTEIDPLHFSAGLTETGAVLILSDNADHESKWELSSEENVITSTWTNEMPMLNELAPRNAKVLFRPLDDGFRFYTTVDKETFDLLYRNRWPKLHQFKMDNNLLGALPESFSWKVANKKSVATFKGKLGDTVLDFSLDQANSDRFVMTFSHNSELLQYLYVPNRLAVSQNTEGMVQTQALMVSRGEKSLQFESIITDGKRTFNLNSDGVSGLPKNATIDLQGEILDDEFNFVSNMMVDETPIKLTISGLNRFSENPTNFMMVTQTGKAQFHLGVLMNEETVVVANSTVTITPDTLKHEYVVKETIFDSIPHTRKEEQVITADDSEYSMVHKVTIDETTNKVSVTYSPQRLEMTQTICELIPQQIVATYNLAIEEGNFKIASGDEILASMEYTLPQNGFKVTANHHMEWLSSVFPIVMEIDTTFDTSSITATYAWGTRDGEFKLVNGLPNNAMLLVTDHSQPLSIEINYNMAESVFTFTSAIVSQENKFDIELGYDTTQADTLMKTMASTDMKWNGMKFSASGSLDVLSINEVFFHVAKECSAGSFLMERRLTWSADENTVNVKVEGTEDSPYYFEVTSSYGPTSATFEMKHDQDCALPKHITVSVTVTQSDSNYGVTVNVTADGKSRIADANLIYNMNDTGLHMDGKITSGFEMVDFQNAGIVLDGNLLPGKLDGFIALQYNGKEYKHNIHFVWYEEKQFKYTFSQTMTDLMSATGGLTLEEVDGGYQLIASRNEETLATKLMMSVDEVSVTSEYTSPAQHGSVGVSATKSPLSVSFSNDFDEIVPIPKSLKVSMDSMEIDNIVVSVESGDGNSELRMNRIANGDLIEHRFHHTLTMLPIPQDVSIQYRITPPELTVTVGEQEFVIQVSDNGFTARQNFVEVLPQSTSVLVTNTAEEPIMSHSIDVNVDDYAFKHQFVFNKQETSISVTDNLIKGETNLLDSSVSSNLGRDTGNQRVAFTQAICEYMPESFGYEVGYTFGESTGTIFLTSGVSVRVTYNVQQENQIQVHVTHNIDDIVDYIPMSTDFVANKLVTESSMSYSATFTSAGVSKAISWTVNYDLDQWIFETTFAHDFDQMQGYLPPFRASVDILSNGKDLNASMYYTASTGERYLKLHSSVTESEFIIKVDQKLFEEARSSWRLRRRHQSQIPDSYSLKVAKDGNDYTMETRFQMGPKRRYLNVVLSTPGQSSRKVWKFKVDHNLNKHLPTKLPTSSVFKYVVTSTDYTVSYDINEADGSLQFTSDSPRYALALSQNTEILNAAGIPSNIKLEIHNMRVVDNSFHVESVFQYNEKELSPIIDVSFDTISIAGSQKGFSTIISSDDFFLKANSAKEENTYRFTTSHNIDALEISGYPKTVVFTSVSTCGQTEGNLVNTAVELAFGEQTYSNNFIVQRNAPTTIEIITTGVRPETFGSSNKINYSGKFSGSFSLTEQTFTSSGYFYEETDSASTVIPRHDFEITGSYLDDSVTMNVTVNFPIFSVNNAKVAGSLKWTNPARISGEWGLGDDSTSVEMAIATGDNFNLRMAKDDTELSLLLDRDAKEQFVFNHNIDALTYVPREVSVGVDLAQYSLTLNTEVGQYLVSFDIQPRSIHATYTFNNEEILAVSGEYSTHPAHKASGTIKIVPFEIDTSASVKIQFFEPIHGKSEIEISMMDNASNRGFYSDIFAYLNDKGIWDTTGAIVASCNCTNLAFEFNTTLELHAKPFKCMLETRYNDYSLKFHSSNESMILSGAIPESYPVHSIEYSVSRSVSLLAYEAHTSLSWNGVEKIATSEVLTLGANTAYEYKLVQPFFQPNTMIVNFGYHEENEWTVVNAGFSEGNGRYIEVSEKWQHESGSFKNAMEVAQTYCAFGNFTVTGSFSWEETGFEAEMSLAKNSQEVATYHETFSYTASQVSHMVSWKQPFTKHIPAGFTETSTVTLSGVTVDVTSDVRHTGDWKYLPQHFKTTGKISFSLAEYEMDWKVESDDAVIASFKDGYQMSDTGFTGHMSWKHPIEQWCTPEMKYTIDVQLAEGVKVDSKLQYLGSEGKVTSEYAGHVVRGQNTIESVHKVTKNGEEVFFMDEHYKMAETGMYMQSGWRQTISDSICKHLNVSVNANVADDGTVTFTLDLDHNDKTFNLDGNAVMGTPALDLTVSIDHTYDNEYIPKSFVTTGVVSVGGFLYDSDWKIVSNEEELVTLRKKFILSEEGLTFLFDWRQPYEDLMTPALLLSSDMTYSDHHVSSVNTFKYNVDTWTSTYDRVSSETTRRYVYTYSKNGEEFRFTSEYTMEPSSFRAVNNLNLPAAFSSSYSLPESNGLEVSMDVEGKTTTVAVTVTSSFLQHPTVAITSWTLNQESVLFDGYVALKRSPAETPGMDAKLGLTVDLLNGMTVSCKIPPVGIDHVINIKYMKERSQIKVTFTPAGQEPIVVTINLGSIVPAVKRVYETLKRKHVLPKMKPIAYYTNDESGFELVLGIKVRETPYTLHFLAGSESEPFSFSIVTKRRNIVVDQVLAVTGKIVDQENIQLEIEINKGLNKYLTIALGSSVAEMKDKVTVIADAVIEVLESFNNFVEGSDMIQSVIDGRRNEAIQTVRVWKSQILDFLTTVETDSKDIFSATESTSGSGLVLLVEYLNTAVKSLIKVINKPWIDLKNSMLTDISNEIYTEIEPMLQPVVLALHKFHAGELFLELVEEGVSKFVFGLDKNMEALLRASQPALAKFMDVTENKVVFTIPLTFQLRDTLSPPTWSDIELWITQSAFADEIRSKMKVLDAALKIYNRIKAILNMPFDEILPPFKGHAELSGFRHIRTFDGKRYSYRSSCSSKHLLVHDTKYHDFKVYVTFEPIPVITITTMNPVEGEETINLKADYSVTDERDRSVVIPTEYNNVIVKRTGEVVSVRTSCGLVVTCNFVSELCTIDISPFYFGQVSGMLGTFNNEPSDDFTGQGNVIIRNSEELAQSWMVSQSVLCSGNNDMQRCDMISNEQCSFLFENERSPFAACFELEDPKPYQLTCTKDTCSRPSSQNGVCRAYASYARRCALQGVFLAAPGACNKCNAVSGNPFVETSQVSVTGADVIFVIERANCLRFGKKDYKKMVGGIHSALAESESIGSINYGVVAFGGPDGLAEPHTVTFGNEIFVETSAGRLRREEERKIVNALRQGAKTSTTSDVLEAISYASQMPLRAGASRTIVLMTCDECSAESKLSLATVQQRLVDQGIVLHHLRQKNIRAGRSSKKVYGFNQDNIFSKSTSYPRSALKVSFLDQCLPLTDLTRGSVWNSNVIGRDAWDLVGTEVSRGVNAVSVQDCTCGVTEFGSTTARCTDSRSRR